MIDKNTHPDFDDDAISYFNNSVYSGDSERIFKTDVLLCCVIMKPEISFYCMTKK